MDYFGSKEYGREEYFSISIKNAMSKNNIDVLDIITDKIISNVSDIKEKGFCTIEVQNYGVVMYAIKAKQSDANPCKNETSGYIYLTTQKDIDTLLKIFISSNGKIYKDNATRIKYEFEEEKVKEFNTEDNIHYSALMLNIRSCLKDIKSSENKAQLLESRYPDNMNFILAINNNTRIEEGLWIHYNIYHNEETDKLAVYIIDPVIRKFVINSNGSDFINIYPEKKEGNVMSKTDTNKLIYYIKEDLKTIKSSAKSARLLLKIDPLIKDEDLAYTSFYSDSDNDCEIFYSIYHNDENDTLGVYIHDDKIRNIMFSENKLYFHIHEPEQTDLSYQLPEGYHANETGVINNGEKAKLKISEIVPNVLKTISDAFVKEDEELVEEIESDMYSSDKMELALIDVKKRIREYVNSNTFTIVNVGDISKRKNLTGYKSTIIADYLYSYNKDTNIKDIIQYIVSYPDTIEDPRTNEVYVCFSDKTLSDKLIEANGGLREVISNPNIYRDSNTLAFIDPYEKKEEVEEVKPTKNQRIFEEIVRQLLFLPNVKEKTKCICFVDTMTKLRNMNIYNYKIMGFHTDVLTSDDNVYIYIHANKLRKRIHKYINDNITKPYKGLDIKVLVLIEIPDEKSDIKYDPLNSGHSLILAKEPQFMKDIRNKKENEETARRFTMGILKSFRKYKSIIFVNKFDIKTAYTDIHEYNYNGEFRASIYSYKDEVYIMINSVDVKQRVHSYVKNNITHYNGRDVKLQKVITVPFEESVEKTEEEIVHERQETEADNIIKMIIDHLNSNELLKGIDEINFISEDSIDQSAHQINDYDNRPFSIWIKMIRQNKCIKQDSLYIYIMEEHVRELIYNHFKEYGISSLKVCGVNIRLCKKIPKNLHTIGYDRGKEIWNTIMKESVFCNRLRTPVVVDRRLPMRKDVEIPNIFEVALFNYKKTLIQVDMDLRPGSIKGYIFVYDESSRNDLLRYLKYTNDNIHFQIGKNKVFEEYTNNLMKDFHKKEDKDMENDLKLNIIFSGMTEESVTYGSINADLGISICEFDKCITIKKNQYVEFAGKDGSIYFNHNGNFRDPISGVVLVPTATGLTRIEGDGEVIVKPKE